MRVGDAFLVEIADQAMRVRKKGLREKAIR